MLGTRLHDAIKKSGMTMDEVAKALDISASNLFKIIKKDSFEVSYLLKAAELFKLPLGYFLDDATLSSIPRTNAQTGDFNQAGNSNTQKVRVDKGQPQQDLAAALAACQRELALANALVAAKEETITLLRATYTRPN